MPHAASIKDLRAHIAHHERAVTQAWPTVGFGAAPLDAALPDHGLQTGSLHEFMIGRYGDYAAMLGFGLGVVARIANRRPGHVLWVTSTHHRFAEGTLYPGILPFFGIEPDRIIHVSVPKPQAMLWVMDDALAHPSLAVVAGILPQNGRAYDFTASRRFSMRAAKSGVTALMFADQPHFGMATAAETRWAVSTKTSTPVFYRGHPTPGLGGPCWAVHLAKSRKGATGQWIVEWDYETLSFRLAPALADRTPQRLSRHAAGKWAAA